eukprot:CAMPEP_0173463002 /NCGR_PEP_ID=MMETSP1357-20121228/67632_1 /TAXON_ID=77926 /ORGANISM="Hemiselmis rufescens, Strain PCC563" /LENGTH=57 /DNA_ID=CAMNT_0014430789 /DNA_START=629 /DNA_END=802 /DNA_ORIENTATION=+
MLGGKARRSGKEAARIKVFASWRAEVMEGGKARVLADWTFAWELLRKWVFRGVDGLA